MTFVVSHISPLRSAFIASALVSMMAGAAFAQLPAPTCSISGPTTVTVGEPFTLCGAAGTGYTYSWYDPSGALLNHDRCLSFPNGLPAGEYDYLFVISQGPAYLKCPVHITVREVAPGRCWLTGGGGKVDDASGRTVHSYGGNINPGCSATAGDGGNWNDIWHTGKLHFQGRSIVVERCGNVAGIPPGSSSPRTPFNYIEFHGVGTLRGIQGNKADYGTVYFWGHYEDRSEPGSHGQPNADARDRYFLRVYSNQANPTGSTLMLVDVDGNSATVDPVTVSHGNLQMHISSCDAAVQQEAVVATIEGGDVEASAMLPTDLWFARATPNPALHGTSLRFGLPRDASVSLRVYDVAGRMVRSLFDGPALAGAHQVSWDLLDRSGQKVSRGLYFARLSVNGVVRSQTVSVSN